MKKRHKIRENCHIMKKKLPQHERKLPQNEKNATK